MFDGDVMKYNHTLIKWFMDRMTIDFNMLGVLMKYLICSNSNSTSVINMNWSKSKLRDTKFS